MSVMSPVNRQRLIYLAATLCVIVCGLLWRWPGLHLPAPVAKYGGSILWGAMVFFAVATLLPRSDLKTVAVLAAILSAAVEFSQLIHVDWLDVFRSTRFGALLLGRTFTWSDIGSYWIGIVAAWCLTSLWARAISR